ncbi:hypothetical protein [Sporichthya sp.]|uniref:hypothetical protein n=1 Tax=Sporichthya sp. TaxID=65475 RepID=UPI00185B1C3C|nr:hypothetical protein [Sporichthya sp.]MBA3742918.1 hypothetical protein [Sporichthya sp.]
MLGGRAGEEGSHVEVDEAACPPHRTQVPVGVDQTGQDNPVAGIDHLDIGQDAGHVVESADRGDKVAVDQQITAGPHRAGDHRDEPSALEQGHRHDRPPDLSLHPCSH